MKTRSQITTLPKILWLLLLAGLLAAPAARAQFTFMTNEGTITITGYTGPSGVVTIPDTINGLPVTSIDNFAFALTNLTSVTIPNSVTTIGIQAFWNCSSLSSVTIPNSVTNIGDEAFGWCTSLTAINVDPGNPSYSSLDGVLFDQSRTNLIQFPPGKGGTYTIPSSVTKIGDSAFYSCASLTYLGIPNSVSNIGYLAFLNCTSLTAINVDPGNPSYSSLDGVLFDQSRTSLIQFPPAKAGTYTIPNSVTSIGDYAFYSCANLTYLGIPNSVAKIGNDSFDGCTSLTAISVDALNPVYSSIDGVLFLNNQIFDNSQTTLIRCPEGKAGRYTTPSSVTAIGDGAFSNCSSLTNVTIGNSVNTIGYGPFFGCSTLTSLTIGTSVSNIGYLAFNYCTSLTAINVDPGNPSYSSLDGILFDKGQTKLIQCPEGKIGTCTIPSSVATIGFMAPGIGAFYGCTSLTAISVDPLNSAFTSVDGVLFDKSRTTLLQCPPGKVSSYTIPDGVISIGVSFGQVSIGGFGSRNDPFSGCTSLTSVTIPNSVTCMCSEDFSFGGCTSLTAAYFHGNQPGWSGGIFSGDNNVTIYYLPGTTGWGPTFAHRPTALWLPQAQTSDASFGLRTNQFGFNINWASGKTVVVEASTTLVNPIWSPVSTNTLAAGSSNFRDPDSKNHPSRFYRFRMP